jgi:hypothetical protein
LIRDIIRNRLSFWFGFQSPPTTLQNVANDIAGFLKPPMYLAMGVSFTAGFVGGVMSAIVVVYWAVAG